MAILHFDDESANKIHLHCLQKHLKINIAKIYNDRTCPFSYTEESLIAPESVRQFANFKMLLFSGSMTACELCGLYIPKNYNNPD